MWESLIRGFGWTIGRHAATDVYHGAKTAAREPREPREHGPLMGLFMFLAYTAILLTKWALQLIMLTAFIIFIMVLIHGVSK